MKHIASCSFGKDSIAAILLALEHGEPLDEAVFVEVMFDRARNISGEIPEHIDWIYSTAIPKLESMGVRTRVLRSERDYVWYFKYTVTRGKREGKKYGFPIGGKCLVNRDCKIMPIRQYLRSLGSEVSQYIGIAADEPKRLARLKPGKVSLLAKYGYTDGIDIGGYGLAAGEGGDAAVSAKVRMDDLDDRGFRKQIVHRTLERDERAGLPADRRRIRCRRREGRPDHRRYPLLRHGSLRASSPKARHQDRHPLLPRCNRLRLGCSDHQCRYQRRAELHLDAAELSARNFRREL